MFLLLCFVHFICVLFTLKDVSGERYIFFVRFSSPSFRGLQSEGTDSEGDQSARDIEFTLLGVCAQRESGEMTQSS